MIVERLVIIGIVLAVLGVSFWAWLERHDERVRSDVIVEINAATKELANEAVEARLPSLRPGAALRLRANSCRDCSTSVPSGN